MKKRLDEICVYRGIFESREKAKRFIMAGEVLVNGMVVCDASKKFDEENIIIEVKAKDLYVSRGGIKLKKAIDYFKIDLKGKVCLDIGVATGGFSDCMLKEGAKKVYGVDVGKGQVHEKILSDPRFYFKPNINARFLKKEIFDDEIDFVGVDVSFISLKLIIPPLLKCLSKKTDIILLVKPQFELQPSELKKGVVKNNELRYKALNDIIEFMKGLNEVEIKGFIDSPIRGEKGNLEFLLYAVYK
jgi:23S rRNA (cytidine1920-2'-O)/16S rRNA (cytidine1409-2'-O)-methyltransferase